MAAIRIGSALTDTVGTTAGQILRVNSGETGFEFFAPSSLPTYTITNASTDRVINANDTSVDELANVVGTLISDLGSLALGVGVAGAPGFTIVDSQDITIPNNGPRGTSTYTITHNMGKNPEFAQLYYRNSPTTGLLQPGRMVNRDVAWTGSEDIVYGFGISYVDANTITATIYGAEYAFTNAGAVMIRLYFL